MPYIERGKAQRLPRLFVVNKKRIGIFHYSEVVVRDSLVLRGSH